jgi:ATPase subunit of ABC transporter with duplicated ATPase domains
MNVRHKYQSRHSGRAFFFLLMRLKTQPTYQICKSDSTMLEPHSKVVLMGNSGVSKTALVDRVTEDIFQDAHVPTAGGQFIIGQLPDVRDAFERMTDLLSQAPTGTRKTSVIGRQPPPRKGTCC